MSKVYILGGAQTDFERNWTKEGKNMIALLKEVVADGFADAGITFDDIRSLNKDNKVVPNYNIISDLAEHRVDCKQSCERLGSCTLCDRGFTLARTLLEAKGGVELN